jgi:hypothetical protein
MRAHFVVMSPPSEEHLTGFVEVSEPMLVQSMVSELTVEALDKGALGRLA